MKEGEVEDEKKLVVIKEGLKGGGGKREREE